MFAPDTIEYGWNMYKMIGVFRHKFQMKSTDWHNNPKARSKQHTKENGSRYCVQIHMHHTLIPIAIVAEIASNTIKYVETLWIVCNEYNEQKRTNKKRQQQQSHRQDKTQRINGSNSNNEQFFFFFLKKWNEKRLLQNV